MNKIKELLTLKLMVKKPKNGLLRKTQKLEIEDIKNTSFNNDSLVSENNDTNIVLKLSNPSRHLKIIANISSEEKGAKSQIFYRSKNQDFVEENSIKFDINSTIVQHIISDFPIMYLRLDAINGSGKFDINYFEVIKISKSELKLAQRLNTVKKIRAKIKQEPKLVKKFIGTIKKHGFKNALKRVNSSLHKDANRLKVNNYKFDNKYIRGKYAMMKNETYFKEYKDYKNSEFDIKAIAFYLPQYHPIPENDLNWERGFTEWTNVTKALPNFEGHYQPQLPIDLGFYDLRIIDNIRRQAELAKNYGIHGFCFHHYWFDGKGIMRTPIDLLLENKDIEISFCINWANENWTKTWDGKEKDILLKQNHSDEDDLKFIQDSSKYFSDERYIKVNGKPILMIYRPSLFPDIKKTVKIWREWYKTNFNEDLYLVLTDSFEDLNPSEIGFDAAINFVPNTLPLESIEYILNIYNQDFKGGIVSYDHAIKAIKNEIQPNFKKFRGVCPSWDNTARRQNTGYIVHGSTPEKYKDWLRHICLDTLKRFKKEESFIFINAWNEWAEGAHLEPDRKFGYAYLEATREVLEEISESKIELVNEINSKFK